MVATRIQHLGLIILAVVVFAPAVRAQTPFVPSSQYLDYVQYELQRRVSATYKQSMQITRPVSSTVYLREAVSCGQDSSEFTSRFEVKREVTNVHGERKIYEELILTRCRERFSVFRMIRFGVAITPTADEQLFRGVFPKVEGVSRYDLSIATGNIKFRFERTLSKALTFTSIVPGDNTDMQYQLDYVEDSDADGSASQSVDVRVINGNRTLEHFQLDHVWRARTDGKPVPRQYLYLDGKEIAPKDYLEITQEIYGSGVFTLVGPTLFLTFPLASL